MVCLLRDKRSAWANEYIVTQTAAEVALDAVRSESQDGLLNEKDKYRRLEEISKEIKEEFPRFLSNVIGSRSHEPQVERKTLLNAYVERHYQKYGKKYSRNDFTSEAQSIIQSCIDDEKKFIAEVDGDKSLIYLTRNGKAFGGIDGLLKEETVNGIGILWSVVITVIGSVGTVRFDWIVDFVKWIFPALW